MADANFAPRPYAPELLIDMARVQAHYLLRMLRETSGGFREVAGAYTCLSGLVLPTVDADDFLTQTERLLLDDADTLSESDRVARFLVYITPLCAGAPLASEADYTRYRWFGSFRYHLHPEERAISLHIRNNSMPRSPFDDLPACCRLLAELGEAAVAEADFEITEVMCGSWLNDLPVFLDFFPPAYRESLEMSPPDSKNGFGWWGQLIDKTGRLHARRAAQIIETGVFPHARKFGKCRYDDFMRHVKGLI